jgi:ABC-2 type transport system permease protein
MNLFLIPMWMLSGSLFPVATAPTWLRAVIRANPVTYAVAALQQALSPEHAALAELGSLATCLFVLLGFAVLMTVVSTLVASARDDR